MSLVIYECSWLFNTLVSKGGQGITKASHKKALTGTSTQGTSRQILIAKRPRLEHTNSGHHLNKDLLCIIIFDKLKNTPSNRTTRNFHLHQTMINHTIVQPRADLSDFVSKMNGKLVTVDPQDPQDFERFTCNRSLTMQTSAVR